MSLKSIKSNYVKMLQVLKDAGVTINESQKEVFDGFMNSIEETILQTRDDAIRMTKSLVEEKNEKEFKQIFESIMTHKKEHAEISEKIQSKVAELNDTKDLVQEVDDFLDSYVEKILPKKDIVDYNRLQKLEKLHESMKEMLSLKESEIFETDKEVKDNSIQDVKKTEEKKEENEDTPSANDSKDKETTAQETTDNAEAENGANESKEEKACVSEEKVEGKSEEAENASAENTPAIQDEIKEVLEKTPVEHEEPEIGEPKENTATQDDVAVEKNLEEAMSEILSREENNASSVNTICGKDVDGTEITPTKANCSDEYCDEPRSVMVTEEMMQNWIDAIIRTTPTEQ